MDFEAFGNLLTDEPDDDPMDYGDESDEPTEPDEGDLYTCDDCHVYEYGGFKRAAVLVIKDARHFNRDIRAYMKRQGFYPNVWSISDHGNAHLLNVWEKSR